MYVDPFWFGFLLGAMSGVGIVFAVAFIMTERRK